MRNLKAIQQRPNVSGPKLRAFHDDHDDEVELEMEARNSNL